MQNNEVIEKIKKLLRMKNGGTQGEIENALYLAKKLADKHNIDLNSVDEGDQREPITHRQSGDPKSRLQSEVKYSAVIVQQFFNVKSISSGFRKQAIVFIGTRTDIDIAQYVFDFLITHFRHEWKTKRGRLRSRQSFMYGMYVGICYKLNQANHLLGEKEGLILSNRNSEIEDYKNERFNNLKNESVVPKNEAKTAMSRGFASGFNTNIRQGLNSEQNRKLLN